MFFLTKICRFLTSLFRAQPNFLIIGAQRSGTTALFNYLCQHPAIAPPLKKEIHYFDHYYWWGRFWYQAHFPWRQRNKITGEASPYYLFHPLAPARAKKVLPRIKLIIILRSPSERAVSHYWHEVRRGFEKLPLAEALKKESRQLAGEREKILKHKNYYSFAFEHYSYLARGIYLPQIKQWRRFFPAKQMLILNYQDLAEKPVMVLTQVFSFLGLKPQPIAPQPCPPRTYPETPAAIKKHLRDYFRPFNQALYAYLDRDFGWEQD